MGKVDRFSIVLTKKPAIFFPGETLSGTVEISVRERLKINSISIVIKGYAHVHW